MLLCRAVRLSIGVNPASSQNRASKKPPGAAEVSSSMAKETDGFPPFKCMWLLQFLDILLFPVASTAAAACWPSMWLLLAKQQQQLHLFSYCTCTLALRCAEHNLYTSGKLRVAHIGLKLAFNHDAMFRAAAGTTAVTAAAAEQ
jgi:hypothetical protein